MELTKQDNYIAFKSLNERTRDALIEALDIAKGNKVYAAKLLGVGRATIYRLMLRYGLRA